VGLDSDPIWTARNAYEQIANWSFVDWMLNFGEETILSTIKIRKAGFADCIDTHESFRRQLTKLRELRVIHSRQSASATLLEDARSILLPQTKGAPFNGAPFRAVNFP
jgi:hypothetical protein